MNSHRSLNQSNLRAHKQITRSPAEIIQHSNNSSNLIDQKILRTQALQGNIKLLPSQDAKAIFGFNFNSQFTNEKKQLISLAVKTNRNFHSTLYLAKEQDNLVEPTLVKNQINLEMLRDIHTNNSIKFQKIDLEENQEPKKQKDLTWLKNLIAPRKEIEQVQNWLHQRLLTLDDKYICKNVDYLDEQQSVLQTAFSELTRQVSNECKERGNLLNLILEGLLRNINEIITDLMKKYNSLQLEQLKEIHAIRDVNLKNNDMMIEEIKKLKIISQDQNEKILHLKKQLSYMQHKESQQFGKEEDQKQQILLLQAKMLDIMRDQMPAIKQKYQDFSINQILMTKHQEFMDKYRGNSITKTNFDKEMYSTMMDIFKQIEHSIQIQHEYEDIERCRINDAQVNTDEIERKDQEIDQHLYQFYKDEGCMASPIIFHLGTQTMVPTSDKIVMVDIKGNSSTIACQTDETN